MHKMNKIDRKIRESANKVLFCDTDCLITQFYLRFLKGDQDNIKLSEAIDGSGK